MDVVRASQPSERWGADPRWCTVAKVVGLALARPYLRLRWEGAEHIPREGPALIVSNHLSNLDPCVLAVRCPRELHFLAKRELLRHPLARFVLPRLGAVALDRTRADLDAARVALRLLRGGRLLVVFPEGTRSRTGQLGPFRPGAAHVALKARVPVVPAAVQGTDQALPLGARWLQPASVLVRYGPAFDLAAFYDAPRGAAALEAATALLRQRVAALLPPAMLPQDLVAGSAMAQGERPESAGGW